MDKPKQQIRVMIVIGVVIMICFCVSISIVLLVINYFSTTDPDIDLFQTCLYASKSDGCESCKEFGSEALRKDEPESVKDLCSYCEYQYNLVVKEDFDLEEVDERCQDNLK